MYEDAHNTLNNIAKTTMAWKKKIAEFQEVTNKFRSVTILANNFGTGSVLNISVQSEQFSKKQNQLVLNCWTNDLKYLSRKMRILYWDGSLS